MNFEGVYTAIVTPFTENGSIDETALINLVEDQINRGISGLVPVGTTGESPTLSHKENNEVIDLICKTVNGRIPVIAGTGSNCTNEAIEMTKSAAASGADASLQVVPYYNRPNQEGLAKHFLTIADQVDLPIMIYNIPGRTGRGLEAETIIRLAKHPNISAIKEASGSFDLAMKIIEGTDENFALLSGDDNITLPLCAIGGKGVVSVASNLIPEKMLELVEKAIRSNIQARELHYKLMPLFNTLSADINPIPIKYAMARIGAIKEHYRLPLVSPTSALKKQIDEVLTELSLIR